MRHRQARLCTQGICVAGKFACAVLISPFALTLQHRRTSLPIVASTITRHQLRCMCPSSQRRRTKSAARSRLKKDRFVRFITNLPLKVAGRLTHHSFISISTSLHPSVSVGRSSSSVLLTLSHHPTNFTAPRCVCQHEAAACPDLR
jgi:hypothetical protein